MDPVEKMLIEKYGVDPEDAYNMALDIRHGGERTGNQDNFMNKLAKEEAYTDVAKDATAWLNRMAKNSEAFTRMHKIKQQGGTLSEKDEYWYNLVLNKQREQYAKAAQERTKQIGMVAADGAHSSRVRGNRMARTAMDGIENTNALVDEAMRQRDTRLGMEQIQRDDIVNRLIAQPQNVMPAIQMPVQPAQPGFGFDAGAANMDPSIAAYVTRMTRGGQ